MIQTCDYPNCTQVSNLHKFVFVARPTEKYICNDHIEPFIEQCKSEDIDIMIIPWSEWGGNR